MILSMNNVMVTITVMLILFMIDKTNRLPKQIMNRIAVINVAILDEHLIPINEDIIIKLSLNMTAIIIMIKADRLSAKVMVIKCVIKLINA